MPQGKARADVKTSRWAPEEDALLRELWPSKLSGREVAARLGRGYAATRGRAVALRVNRPAPCRRWTAAEDAVLRAERLAGRPFGEIAALLPGRTYWSVHNRVFALGLFSSQVFGPDEVARVRAGWRGRSAEQIAAAVYGDAALANRVRAIIANKNFDRVPGPGREPTVTVPEVLGRVKDLHAGGATTAEIAAAMGDVLKAKHPTGQVRRLLRALGLKAHPDPAARERSRVAALEAHGVASMVELRRKRAAQLAERYGLPGDLSVAQVRVVVLLADGPKTIPQICAALGWRGVWNVQHNVQRGAAPVSLFGDLIRRGLVASLAGQRFGGGRGSLRSTYLLTARAMGLLAAAVRRTLAGRAAEGGAP